MRDEPPVRPDLGVNDRLSALEMFGF